MSTLPPAGSPDASTDVQSSVATQRPWSVIVWDDPVTLMTVVVAIFKKVFGYPTEKATRLMMTVHHEGRAVVWTGKREKAEGYCVRLHSHGLLATIEQSD